MTEVRFLILLPDDPAEVLAATPLIRCLKQQVSDSWVHPVVQENHAWIFENNPWASESYIWKSKPDERIEEVKEQQPDYMIDLEGKRLYRRLKRKTKVLDFCIGRVSRSIASTPRDRMFRTVHLFDVTDDQKNTEWFPPAFESEWLPGKFSTGFIFLSLEGCETSKGFGEDELVHWISLIEKPLVLAGPAALRPMADRIVQRTGCTVFPICGDFNPAQQSSIMSASAGVAGFNAFWPDAAECLGKPVVRLGSEGAKDPVELARQVRQWLEPKP